MKKILFDVREIEKGKKTGIGRFILAILRNKDYFKDFKFILIGNKKTDFENSLLNFERYIINDEIPLLSEQFEINTLIKKIKPDIYFSPYYKYPVLTEVPVITSIFDIMYLKIDPYKKNPVNCIYIKSFIKYFTSKSTVIITSSNYTKRDIISYFNIDEQKIKVVYLPLDESFKPQSSDKINLVRKKYQLNEKYILYVGNNQSHKNIKQLYKAYELLPENMKKEYFLVFAGFSDIKNEYPYARVLGYVDDEDLKALYSGCSLFVFPSLYEGFGYPPLEAVACGANVLSSNSSSLPEILDNMVDYFNPEDLFELKEKMIKLLSKKSEKKDIELSKFNIDNFLYKVKEILNSLLN